MKPKYTPKIGDLLCFTDDCLLFVKRKDLLVWGVWILSGYHTSYNICTIEDFVLSNPDVVVCE